MKTLIRTTSLEDNETVIKMLVSFGFEKPINLGNFESYNYIVVGYDNSNVLTRANSKYTKYDISFDWPADATKILALRPEKKIKIFNVGTDGYEATVSKANLVVGCQTISWEKFAEIEAARKEVFEENKTEYPGP